MTTAAITRPTALRRALTVILWTVTALISIAAMLLLMSSAWLVWHAEYGLGLPNEKQLAAIAHSGPVCSSGEKQAFIPLDQIPPLVRKAVLAYEEPDFFERPSINPAREIILSGRRARHSPVSTSVTRCLMSLDESCCKQGLDWHIANIVLMGRVEETLSRDRIFEIYLNETYFGRGSYGVANAAETYFGKSLGELDVAEVAAIAILPRRSWAWKNGEQMRERRNFAIDRMRQAGLIGESEVLSAKQRPLDLRPMLPRGRNAEDSL